MSYDTNRKEWTVTHNLLASGDKLPIWGKRSAVEFELLKAIVNCVIDPIAVPLVDDLLISSANIDPYSARGWVFQAAEFDHMELELLSAQINALFEAVERWCVVAELWSANAASYLPPLFRACQDLERSIGRLDGYYPSQTVQHPVHKRISLLLEIGRVTMSEIGRRCAALGPQRPAGLPRSPRSLQRLTELVTAGFADNRAPAELPQIAYVTARFNHHLLT